MDTRSSPEVPSAGDLDRVAGAARDLLHRSGALAVRVAVDRGEGAPAALVACERFGPIEVTEGDRTVHLAHDAALPAWSQAAEVEQAGPVQVDPAEGRVGAPLGALHGLGDVLTALAALAGGRSVAAALLETDHEDAPLGLAARPGERPVVTLGDAEYELPA